MLFAFLSLISPLLPPPPLASPPTLFLFFVAISWPIFQQANNGEREREKEEEK